MIRLGKTISWRRIIAAGLLALWLVSCANVETTKQKLLASGNDYYQQGRYREAAIMFSRAIEQDRRFGEAYFRLARAQINLGRYVPAARSLHRAVELLPDNQEAFALLCEIYLRGMESDPLRRGDYIAEVKDLLKQAEGKGKNPFQVARIHGLVAAAEGDLASAVTYLEEARSLDPGNDKVLLSLARVLVEEKQFDKAKMLAGEVLSERPDFGPMYDRLYAAYLLSGDPEAAEEVIRRKCKNNPDVEGFQLELAAHYHRVGKPAERDAVLKKLESKPAISVRSMDLLAEFYENIRDFDKAVVLYRRAARKVSAERISYELRTASALASGGRGADALSAVDQVLKDDPKNTDAVALRGALRLYGGDPNATTGALNDLESVLSDMPRNPVLRFNLGQAYLAIGDADKAMVQFQEAANLLPTYQAPRFRLGQIYLAKGQASSAAEVADQILKVNRRSWPGRLLRASAALRLQEYNQAAQYISSMLDEDANNADAQFLLASLHVAQRDFRQAEAVLRKLYETSPQDSRGIRGLIELYTADGRPEAAQKLLDAELAKNPDSPQLLLVSANVAVQAKNYKRAISDYGRLLEKDPSQTRVHISIGMAYYYARQFDKAEEHLRATQRLQPDNLSAKLRLALLVGEEGRMEECRKLLDDVLKLAPSNYAALNNMAYILSQSNSTINSALTLAKKAVGLTPPSQQAIVSETLGWIYYKKGMSSQAVEVYRDVIAKRPDNPKWRYRYALALYQNGQPRQAGEELRIAMACKPNTKEKEQIQSLLKRIGQ